MRSSWDFPGGHPYYQSMAVSWGLDTPVLVSSHWQQLQPPALSALHASAHLGHCQVSLSDSAPSLACGAASTPLWDFWKLSPGPESAPGFLICSHAMLPASTGVSEDKPQVPTSDLPCAGH